MLPSVPAIAAAPAPAPAVPAAGGESVAPPVILAQAADGGAKLSACRVGGPDALVAAPQDSARAPTPPTPLLVVGAASVRLPPAQAVPAGPSVSHPPRSAREVELEKLLAVCCDYISKMPIAARRGWWRLAPACPRPSRPLSRFRSLGSRRHGTLSM